MSSTALQSTNEHETAKPSKRLHVGLWVVQGLLAAIFLMSGTMKFVMPPETLAQMGIAPGLAAFIGISEIAGALGMILPAATLIRPALTPLAGLGLVIVMVLATGYHLQRGELSHTPVTIVLGALAAFVAWGRFKAAPIAART